MNINHLNLQHLTILTVLALGWMVSAQAATDGSADKGRIAIHCGLLIDGVSDDARTDKVVIIIDGRVAEVLNADHFTASAYPIEFLDLSNKSCLPGLIDTHTHIAEPAGAADLSYFYTITEEENRAAGIINADTTLMAGFTTARNLGTYVGWGGRDLRDRINAGEFPGPRMQVAGFYLTIPGGGGDLVIPGHDEADIPKWSRYGVARGPDDLRRAAQEAVDGGADVLKVIASGAVLAYGGVPGAPEMTPEEIRAIVEVGHAAGIKVTAHAHGAQSVREAILAGVDSVEHASLADDEAIALAAERKVALSMDVYNGDYIATAGVEQGWPEEFLRKNFETTEAQRQVFTRAHAAGVPIIFGTDSGVYPHGDNAKQFPIMVERGMSEMEAIQAATSVAARYIGWDDDVGALVPGRYGDLIALEGNPLDDIALLQQIEVVVKGGVVYGDAAR